ncbi:MAG TPA: hypothetical protein VGO58_07610 [Chitinophagaceae bacterium]|nr:hypothetical protein [Chitinophagaceae bacterium]
MGILEGAIIGGVIGAVVVIAQSSAKLNRYKTVMKSVPEPVDYSGVYHYASFKRYKNFFKFYDSYGALYMVGNMVYYKTKEKETPVAFNMQECSIQLEPDWRWLKWFSITTPAGEKYYFNSNKMGAFKNNSDETLKGFEVIKAKTTA